jgi:hypothetical protein
MQILRRPRKRIAITAAAGRIEPAYVTLLSEDNWRSGSAAALPSRCPGSSRCCRARPRCPGDGVWRNDVVAEWIENRASAKLMYSWRMPSSRLVR